MITVTAPEWVGLVPLAVTLILAGVVVLALYARAKEREDSPPPTPPATPYQCPYCKVEDPQNWTRFPLKRDAAPDIRIHDPRSRA